MVINHNIASIGAQNSLHASNYGMQKSIEKLSTGLRINRASDDAAGLSVSENLRAQVKGLKMADRNAQDGISAMQIAEGSLNEVSAILQRMRELSVEGATDTLTDTDRGYLNQEYTQLTAEVDRIMEATEFNGMQLLNGNWTGKDLQIGANNTDNDRLTTTITTISSTSLGIDTGTIADGISTRTASRQAMDALDNAIDSVNSQRSDIGSYVNRLEHSVANLKNSALNMQAAESQVRDVDVGNEMANFTKLQILSQAGTSMLSQANQSTQGAMSLFR